MTPERRIALFGTDEPTAVPIRLQAGSLSLELIAGAVRALRWDGAEIVRCIAFLIRDEAWGTPPAVLDPPEIEQGAESFRVRWRGRIEVGGARFAFEASLQGEADGHFAFAVEGASDADLSTNRAGFVVLHPAGFAGREVAVEHVDGNLKQGRFPTVISPGQPISDVRALRYGMPDGSDVTCRMLASLPNDADGRFEMEDQRNWCDASFKTYVGSLLRPWPYTLPARQQLVQSVEVAIRPRPSRSKCSGVCSASREPYRLMPELTQACLPEFGIGVPHGAATLTPRDIEAVAALRLAWHVVEADLRRPDIGAHLSAAARLASAAGARIQLELVSPADASPAEEVALGARICRDAGLSPAAVLVCPAPYLKSYQPSGPWPSIPPLEKWYAAARQAFPHAEIGGGVLTNFTELNRLRPPNRGIDFISHTTTPIVHDADDQAVMETLEALPQIALSVRSIWPVVPYRLGPSSIPMRSNPYGDEIVRNPHGRRQALADRDPRHPALFGAAWTVGHAAALAEAGLSCLHLHATHGFSSVLTRTGVIPAYHVLAKVGDAGGRPLLRLGEDARLAGFAWRNDAGVSGLMANLTADAVPFEAPGMETRVLDEFALPGAGATGWLAGAFGPPPKELGPYAVVFFKGAPAGA